MCGIFGYISSSSLPESTLLKFSATMAHRGPDAEGFLNQGNVQLGHRRLSILDLSAAGNQPMTLPDRSVSIVFNGEIFNYRQIKEELIALGHSFSTSSDTEVILHAYKEWGTDCFKRLEGMFALALSDVKRDKLVLARDPSGIKPLYYYAGKDQFLFASEIRLFKSFHPDWPGHPHWPVWFLSMGFIPAPFTLLKDVYSLPKGECMEIHTPTLSYKSFRFYERKFSHAITREREALELVRYRFFQAVEDHLISDAPIGIFLSGGIDSSLIALTADRLGYKNLNTLSVTFDEADFNEQSYQERVLLEMRKHEHKNYRVNCKMFMDQLEDVFSAMDQPSWDGVNSYFISQCARDFGLKAVLSGIGGDELFGGYPSFNRIWLLKLIRSLPPSQSIKLRHFNTRFTDRLSFDQVLGPYGDYLLLRGCFDPYATARITGRKPEEILSILSHLPLHGESPGYNANRASWLESDVYMSNQLLRDTDYMSMWHSLEVRVPFLDKQLVDLVSSISPRIKFKKARPKYLLTKAFEDLLPNEIVFRKKTGFTFPFSIWLKNNIHHFKPMLADTPLTETTLHQFLEGSVHWSKIWTLIILKKFLNE